MRVLHVNQKAGFFGGVERILFDTAQSLAGQGWPQALLHGDADAAEDYLTAFSASASSDDILNSFKPDVLLIHKLDDHQRLARLAAAVPAVRMVHDHDLVCLRHHKYFPLNTQICEKPAGINCYSHLCFVQKSAPGSLLPIRFASLRQQKNIMRANDGIRTFIAISQWMAEELRMNGYSEDKFTILSPIPRALGSIKPLPPSGEAEILFVGQLIRGKGVDLMIRALASIPEPQKWHATIVGAGHHLEECQNIARELGIDQKIDFTGWINHEELQDYYRRALFSVVPSRWPEPFGMVGIEAMARARPVVAFAAGGIADWLKDGETGFLVPPADIDAMGQAMSTLLADPEQVARMGQAAVLDVEERFSHAAYIDQMKIILANATTS